MSQSPPPPQPLEAVLAGLTDALPELADETCLRIYRDLEAYPGIVARVDLEAAVARNLTTALSALRIGKAPTSDALVEADTTAKERYAVGVPVEQIILGFRLSFSLIHERYIDLSVTLGMPVDDLIAGSRILWDVADSFTTRIVTTYHDLEVSAALADARRRAAVVQALLEGRWPSDPAVYSLDPRSSYAVVRCAVPPGAEAEPIRQHLETTGSQGSAHALVVIDNGECVGIVARRPTGLDLAIGLGPFVPHADMPRSGRLAAQALRLAERLGRTGVQGLEELGWRLAAVSRTDVGVLYADRFLTPLTAEGEFGREMLEAVHAWLRHGQSIPRTAEALNVHVNTARYRLRRYQDLTGADLSDIDDVIGIAWALELGHPNQSDL